MKRGRKEKKTMKRGNEEGQKKEEMKGKGRKAIKTVLSRKRKIRQEEKKKKQDEKKNEKKNVHLDSNQRLLG